MRTRHLTTEIGEAAAILRGGGLVAVPTETVYGLACSGLDEQAVERVYEVKGRPAVKPLSLMVPGAEAIDRLCRDVPEAAYRLAERFWPGPLTIVLKARPEIPAIVRAGGATVGLRCPDHPLTLALLRETGLPFAAPGIGTVALIALMTLILCVLIGAAASARTAYRLSRVDAGIALREGN